MTLAVTDICVMTAVHWCHILKLFPDSPHSTPHPQSLTTDLTREPERHVFSGSVSAEVMDTGPGDPTRRVQYIAWYTSNNKQKV